MAGTAALTRRASLLTEHGLRLALGTLIGYSDPVVRTAVLAALGGAEAGQGLTEEPGGPLRSLWRRPLGESAWEHHCDGSLDVLSASAHRWRGLRDPDGVTADYLVLPVGETPDDDSLVEASAASAWNACGSPGGAL